MAYEECYAHYWHDRFDPNDCRQHSRHQKPTGYSRRPVNCRGQQSKNCDHEPQLPAKFANDSQISFHLDGSTPENGGDYRLDEQRSLEILLPTTGQMLCSFNRISEPAIQVLLKTLRR